MAKVSVVVPTYNVEAYIAKCLDALLGQDYDDFNVFVIDDGSPKNERAIVEPFVAKFPHIFNYIRKENGGYGSVLEYAFNTLKSKYILVCDPDDWLEKSAISKLVNLAEEHDSDITCSARFLVYSDVNSKHYDKMFNSSFVQLTDNKVYQKNDVNFQDIYLIENAPHGKLFKRENLLGLSFPQKTTNTDALLFYYACFKAEKVIYTAEPLANYLIDRFGNSVTEIKPKVVDELNKVHQLIIKESENFKDIEDAFYFQMFTAFYYICDRCDVLEGSNVLKKEKLKETGRLLNYLMPHRKKIMNFYFKTSLSNKNTGFKYALMLNPLSTRWVRNIWFDKRIRRIKNEHFLQIPNEILSKTYDYKVSVVVPVYNVEKYLAKCLDSLVNQSIDSYEILVINDGTKDQSQDIIDQYVKNYPDIVKSFIKPNGGLSDARNFGVKQAKGEYIAFIDSDDWVDSQMMEKLFNKAKMTQADIAVCDMEYVYEDGSTEASSGGDFSCVDVLEFPNIVTINNSACNKLYRTQLFEVIEFEKGIWYEDLATIPKLISISNRIVKVDEPLYKYFQRWNSIVHTQNPKVFDIYVAVQSVRKFLEDKGTYPLYRKYVEKLAVVHGADLTTVRIKDFDGDRIQYLKENMQKLEAFYPNWYFNSVVWHAPFKKWVVFTLNKLRLYSLLLKLYDRKGQV
jgi:glycosyltransferase involved in cell wall biosynthesis